jgi:hypothetical protein
VDKFCRLADSSPHVPKLIKKKYNDYLLTEGEWELLALIKEVLQVCCPLLLTVSHFSPFIAPQHPRDAQATFSSETHPTVWRTIPTLECLLVNWKNLSKIPKFVRVKPALEKGIAKIEKWYKATSQSDIAFACLGTCFT